MSRKLLVVAVVVVAAIAVIVARRSGSKSGTETGSATGSQVSGASGAAAGGAGASASGGSGSSARPPMVAVGSDGVDGNVAPGTLVQRVGSDGTITIGDGPRMGGEAGGSAAEYSVGNVNVRDHRGSGAKPVDVPPNVHVPGGPLIDSSVTSDIGQKVRAVIYACAREAGREGREGEPRIDGQFVSNIKGGELKIVSAIVQPRGLGETATAQVKQCVETKVIGLTASAPNQTDLDNYGINISLRLP